MALAAAYALGALLFAFGDRERRAAWELRHMAGITSPSVEPWVREVVGCLERLGARRFRVEGRLAADYRSYQPLVVAAWPIEASRGSLLVVVRADELGTLGCRPEVVCRAEEAAVAACAP